MRPGAECLVVSLPAALQSVAGTDTLHNQPKAPPADKGGGGGGGL